VLHWLTMLLPSLTEVVQMADGVVEVATNSVRCCYKRDRAGGIFLLIWYIRILFFYNNYVVLLQWYKLLLWYLWRATSATPVLLQYHFFFSTEFLGDVSNVVLFFPTTTQTFCHDVSGKVSSELTIEFYVFFYFVGEPFVATIAVSFAACVLLWK
jgi:hypothetical protein